MIIYTIWFILLLCWTWFLLKLFIEGRLTKLSKTITISLFVFISYKVYILLSGLGIFVGTPYIKIGYILIVSIVTITLYLNTHND